MSTVKLMQVSKKVQINEMTPRKTEGEASANNPGSCFEASHATAINFDQELEGLYLRNKKHEKTYLELENAIKKSPILSIKNPIRGSCDKIKTYYLNHEKRISESCKNLNAEYTSLVAQENKLLSCIKNFRNDSEAKRRELAEWKKKFHEAEEAFQLHENAFNIARNLFGSKFGMKVDIENRNQSNETFVAIVYFDNDSKKSVRFTIDHVQQKIIDFDASLLHSEEIELLKKNFKENNNAQALTCALINKYKSRNLI